LLTWARRLLRKASRLSNAKLVVIGWGVFTVASAIVTFLLTAGTWPGVATFLGLGLILLLIRSYGGGRAKERLEGFQRSLDKATRASSATFSEDLRIVHYVGKTSEGDRTVWTCDTKATADQRLVWRSFGPGATGSSLRHETFDDIKARVEALDPDTSVELVPTREGANGLRALVLFMPHVTDRPRRWRLSYEWHGLWDPLRDKGEDSGFVDLTYDASILQITIVFPAGSSEMKFEAREPQVGTVSATDIGGDPRLSGGSKCRHEASTSIRYEPESRKGDTLTIVPAASTILGQRHALYGSRSRLSRPDR
jgi:hypothetical protein